MKITNLNGLRSFKTKILLASCISLSVTSISPCFAQSNIVPDSTLGSEASKVNNNVNNPDGIPSTLIEGGAERGQNLFHSLQEFNVNEGRGAYFVVPNDIQNVLTRVTGNNASLIEGILGTISNRNFNPTNANLFLINPNGIIFGENASLNVNGSFVGTTANGISFGEQGFFSATNPQAPPLLTVDPDGLLFNKINRNARIQNNSVADSGTDPAGFNVFGLRVPDGKSLLLLGGDVSMDGGKLNAYGGRVDLGGLTEPGTVALDVSNDNFSLGFPENVIRGDVSLTNRASVSVVADGGGDIAVNARNVDITGGSFLFAGIGRGLGTPEAQAGDIIINATDLVTFDGEDKNGSQSGAYSNVNSEAEGDAGGVSITTGSLEVLNGAVVDATTVGKGNAGNVTIEADDLVKIDGETNQGKNSGAFSQVLSGAEGDAGGVSITTGSLEVTNGAKVAASTFGNGNAGSVTIEANDLVTFDGEDKNGSQSGAYSNVDFEAEGDAGGVSITTGSLEVLNGAVVDATTVGKGNAGNVTIEADDLVKIDGETNQGKIGGAFSQVLSGAEGKAGGVSITTGSLEVTNGAEVAASTFGKGNAGSVKIHATDLVKFDGETRDRRDSGAYSRVFSGAEGDAGGVSITTGSLEVTNGALLSASTFGKGNAGTVEITANDLVKFDGEGNDRFPSGAYSRVLDGAEGDAGGVSITTRYLEVLNGAVVDATTFGKGNAGTVEIHATDLVKFDGETNQGKNSGAFSEVFSGAEGKAGGVSITTGSLEVTNGAKVAASTFGNGNAGSVKIHATDLVTFDGEDKNGSQSGAYSNVNSEAEGDAGGVSITTGSLEVLNGAVVDATTVGKGNAGNVTIEADDLVKIDGETNQGKIGGAFSQVLSGAEGDAGGVSITTGSLEVTNGAEVAASTFGKGNAGSVKIHATDLVKFDSETRDRRDSGAYSRVFSGAEGDAGGVSITTGSLEVTNGALLSASTFGKGNAGTVEITANDLVKFDGEGNDRFPSGAYSRVLRGAEGTAGGVSITTTGSLEVLNGAQLSASTLGKGNGGNLTVNTDTLQLKNDGIIVARSRSDSGIAGNIEIKVKNNFNADNGQVITSSERTSGGNIDITGKNIILRNDSDISTTLDSTQGSGGNITLNANAIVALEDSDILAFAAEGRGGNIIFNTRAFFSEPLFSSRPQNAEPLTAQELNQLEGNERVDVDASGSISSGTITGQTDPGFLQNSFTQLPQNQISSEALIASSCVARNNKRNGTYYIIGSQGFPYSPGDPVPSKYSAIGVQSVPNNTTSSTKPRRRWKMGDPVVEPTGMYTLENGRRILSRECGT